MRDMSITCFIILCIILTFSIDTTIAFPLAPTISLTGPRISYEAYASIPETSNSYRPTSAQSSLDILDFNFGEVPVADLIPIDSIILDIEWEIDAFEYNSCFWVRYHPTTKHMFTYYQTSSSDNINDPELHGWYQYIMIHNSAISSDVDFPGYDIIYRCHVFIRPDIDPTIYNDMVLNVYYRFVDEGTEMISFTALSITPTPQYPPFRTTVTSAPIFTGDIKSLTNFDTTTTIDGTTTLTFRHNFSPSNFPQRGDTIYIKIGYFYYGMESNRFDCSCTFSTNFIESSIQWEYDGYISNALIDLQLLPIYNPSEPITGDISGYVDCSIKLHYSFSQLTSLDYRSQSDTNLFITSIDYYDIRYEFDSTYGGHNGTYYSSTDSTTQFPNTSITQSTIPQFISRNTWSEFNTIDITFSSPLCTDSDDPRSGECYITIPPSGTNVTVVAKIITDNINIFFPIGTTILHWDIPIHTISLFRTNFPTGYPIAYYIRSSFTSSMEVGNAYYGNTNIFFVSDCMSVIDTTVIDEYTEEEVQWFDLDINTLVCSNGTDCDATSSGLCFCPIDRESYFNPFYTLIGDDACSLTPPDCSNIITCIGNSTSIRNEYNQCICQCPDDTNPWRDCRDDTVPITYTPRTIIQQAPYDYETTDIIPVPDVLVGTTIAFHFGTLTDFYQANLNQIEYFYIKLHNTPEEYNDFRWINRNNGATFPYGPNGEDIYVNDDDCQFVVKEPNVWFNKNVHPSRDDTIKAAEYAPNLFNSDYRYDVRDTALLDRLKIQNDGVHFGLFTNPYYKSSPPSPSTAHLEIFLECRASIVEGLDYTQFTASIDVIGTMYEKRYEMIPQFPSAIPTEAFIAGQPTNIRLQPVPNLPAVRLLFEMTLTSPPYARDYFSVDRYDTNNWTFLSCQCRFMQTTTLVTTFTVWDTIQFIDFGHTTYPNNNGGVLSCSYFIQSINNAFVDSDALITELTGKDVLNILKWYRANTDESTLNYLVQVPEEPTIIAPEDSHNSLSIGQRVWFSIDHNEYPSFDQFVKDTTIMFARVIYPSGSGLDPIELGYAIYVDAVVIATITAQNLKYWNQGGLSYELFFPNPPHPSLERVPIRLTSHINPIIYPFCMKIEPGETIEEEIAISNCPGTGTCDAVTNGSNTCTCPDNTTNCLCTNNDTIWSGFACEPNCNIGLEWNAQYLKCVDECTDGQVWDNINGECSGGCAADQFWNGAYCYYPCTFDQILTINHQNGYSCTPRCLETERWNGVNCIASCTVGYRWDQSTFTCVSKCTLNQYWDNTNDICVDKCPTDARWMEADGGCVPIDTLCDSFLVWNDNLWKCVCPTDFRIIGGECVPIGCSPGDEVCNGCPVHYVWDSYYCMPTPCVNDQVYHHIDGCIEDCSLRDLTWDTTFKACIQDCQNGLIWNNDHQQCIQDCQNGLIWNNDHQQCIENCQNDLIWDNGRQQCIEDCPLRNLIWNDEHQQCTQDCENDLIWENVKQECVTNTNPCSLSCRNGSTFIQTECKCQCPTSTFYIGTLCETCNIQCFNQGVANIGCSSCSCPRRGYTGVQCECHEISFTLVLSGAPQLILDEFEKDPINAGSAETALNYIRSQLLKQPLAQSLTTSATQLFETLKIQQITLIEGRLTINGAVRDNCQTIIDQNNYSLLQEKWTAFLNGLKTIVFDDGTTVTVESTAFLLPALTCDTLFDSDCDGVMVFEQRAPNSTSTSNLSSFIIASIAIIIISFASIIV